MTSAETRPVPGETDTDPDIVAELLGELPEGFRQERLHRDNIPEWDSIIAGANSSRRRSLSLAGLPVRLRVEQAWMMWWDVRAGYHLDLGSWGPWAGHLRWAVDNGAILPDSLTDRTREQWHECWQHWYVQRNGCLPGHRWHENAAIVFGRPLTALTARESTQPWWRMNLWHPQCDPRIPQRPVEPRWDKRQRWDRYTHVWLREAGKWWLGLQLESGAQSWSTVCASTSSHLLLLDQWLAESRVDLFSASDEQLAQAATDFHTWSANPANRNASLGRVPQAASPSVQRNMFGVLHRFFEFLYANKHDAATVLGDDRWDRLREAHCEAWLIPARSLKKRPARQPSPRYMDPTAMTAIMQHLHILGAERTQRFDLDIDGQRHEVAGFGDPQAMRAVLLQALTGRRMNEILLMTFDPLTPVEHVGSEAQGHGLTRLTYAQSKIDQAPDTILVDDEVVEVVREQQRWLRTRYPHHADEDFRYLFVGLNGNRDASRPYSSHCYGDVLRKFARTLQLRDSNGELVTFYRTHNFRHTRFTELAEMGVPVHVLQRYAGHTTPTMSLRYVAAREEHQEQVFLATQKVRADGRDFEFSPELYDAMHLFDRADRMLPNGWCLLPPLQNCDKGNACLSCSEFVTDPTHLASLREQLTETEELIARRQQQFHQRTGETMPENNVWLRERTTEVAGLRALIEKLSTASQPVRGGGTDAAATTVPLTLDTSRLRST